MSRGGRSDKGDLRVVRTEQEMGRVMGTGKKCEGGGQEQNKRETSGGEHWRDRVRIYGSKHIRREELFPGK